MVRQFLDDIGDVAELDQLDDVTVQAQNVVDVGHVPGLERTSKRQLGNGGMIGGMSNLEAHLAILAPFGADRANHKFLQEVLKPKST